GGGDLRDRARGADRRLEHAEGVAGRGRAAARLDRSRPPGQHRVGARGALVGLAVVRPACRRGERIVAGRSGPARACLHGRLLLAEWQGQRAEWAELRARLTAYDDGSRVRRLAGPGRVRIDVAPAGAQAELDRLDPEGGGTIGAARSLGAAPLAPLTLAPGS